MMNHQPPAHSPTFDVDVIRRQFPLLSELAHGQPLIYLDNAATTQKPESVIQVLTTYYQCSNANVHRAAHYLSARATHAFEDAREQVRRFLNAAAAEEIIWARGATEAINLVASSWGQSQLKRGDEVLVSRLEHHANIVPWQLLASSTGVVIKVIELDESGRIDLEHFQRQLSDRTRIVAITQASNAIGSLTPLTTIINTAHDAGALVLVDGAQAAAHCPLDVQAMGCDFYVFSGHKAYGPTGIGVLYGRRELLEAMPPWQGGGEMIEKVSFSGTRFNRLPFKFEAGTPHIAGAIGLAQGLSFIQSMDSEALLLHERQLLSQAEEGLAAIKGVKVVGGALKEGVEKAPMVSFISEVLHNQDIGMMLDQQGIAVRTGHHCAMPLMESLNLQGTVRASFAAYNNPADVSTFILALERLHHPGFHQVPDVSGVVDRTEAIGQPSLPEVFSNFASVLETCVQKGLSKEKAGENAERIKRLKSLKGWQEKYREIMLLGKQLPALPIKWKTDAARLHGCESTVWLHHYYDDETMKLHFIADSDARVIRGLIALVLSALSGKTALEIEQVDLESWFMELDLFTHLSPSRGNGLKAIIREIKAIAHRYQ